MTARCLPNDRCLVIAEVAGCEANIGAHITVEALAPLPPGCTHAPVWTFRDASRPLVLIDHDAPGGPITSFTDGDPHLSLAERPVIYDHHLVPLRDIGGASIDDVAAAAHAHA